MVLRLSPVVDLRADHGEELLARPQRTRLTGTKRDEEVRNAEGGGVRIDEGCSRVEEDVMGDIQWLLLRPCSSHHISYTVTARQERGKKITRLLIRLTPLASQSDRQTDRQTDTAVTFSTAGAGMMPFQVAIHIMVFITTSFSTNMSLLVIREHPAR